MGLLPHNVRSSTALRPAITLRSISIFSSFCIARTKKLSFILSPSLCYCFLVVQAFVTAPSSRGTTSGSASGTFITHTNRRSAIATPNTSRCHHTTIMGTNPLLADWSNRPFRLPPFDEIRAEHFIPALEMAMEQHVEELQAIVENATDPPSFESVIAAYDRSGRLLNRVRGVYSNLGSSLNTKDLQAVQRTMAPILANHASQTYQLPGLFAKIRTVYEQRHGHLPNEPEKIRLTERIYLDFTRAGAALPEADQNELTQLQAELATLMTAFTQNVLHDEEVYELVLKAEDFTGCPDFIVEAAKTAAMPRHKDQDGVYVLTLSRSLVEPFLTFADRRDLRQQLWEAWVKRGELYPDHDNRAIAVDILKIRQRVAQIHGYPSFAAYQCADRMAKTPENVMELLEKVWARAKDAADREREAMEEFLAQQGIKLDGGIQPWDWRYYAAKVRKANYDLDEALLKPYFTLQNIREAMFAVSGKLFGLSYHLRTDLDAYHPDVDIYEVRNDDRLVSLFLHDNYVRPFKASGAWMSEFRTQTRNLRTDDDPIEGIPIVVNNNNLAPSKEATLLSYDEANTMFHEFGHAHHGMLSDCTFERLASTNVLQDFVELPSQLMEHWFRRREVLKQYARHFVSGESIPDDLLDKLDAARNFQQGFQTVEYTACALLDMALHHRIQEYENFDLGAFEDAELSRLGMPQGIVLRHRPAHFQHLFSTNSYAAGYYVYLWAEVLDADAFAAFEETGNIFDPDTASRARQFIYGAGDTVAPDELFRRFRGRDPDTAFMLRKKGLVEATG